jgi:hypothetical protein
MNRLKKEVTMAAKKRPGNMRDLSDLAGSMLQDIRDDFSTKGLSSSALQKEYVGVNIALLQEKYCEIAKESQVEFDLALSELEKALFISTGPMAPFENKPGSGFVVLGFFSKREYVYLKEAGYRAAAQMTNQKPRNTPRQNVHISGGTFNQSPIGIGEHVTQMQRVDVGNEVGPALIALTEAIRSEHSLSQSDRESMLDQIDYLKEQAAHPAKDRKPGVIRATLTRLIPLTQVTLDVVVE